MRDILFRGKRVDGGEWVYGNYALTDYFGEQHFIFQNNPFDYKVDPETVGQCTEHIDKNGTKIFEGDIVQNATTKETAVVRWYEEHSAFMLFDKNNSKLYFLYDNNFNNLVVIGNIYDNPELLEVG